MSSPFLLYNKPNRKQVTSLKKMLNLYKKGEKEKSIKEWLKFAYHENERAYQNSLITHIFMYPKAVPVNKNVSVESVIIVKTQSPAV